MSNVTHLHEPVDPLDPAPTGLDLLAPPDASGVTRVAVLRSVAEVDEECRGISGTLEALGGALGTLGAGGGEGGTDWGSFGMMGLPILAAARTVRSVANHVVEQQTGMRLTQWTDLVARSTEQFDAYLRQLARARTALEHSHGSDPTPGPLLEVLTDLQHQTVGWKLVLRRVVQLGKVVDAVLHAAEGPLAGAEPHPTEASSTGLAGSLQRRLKDVQTRTVDKTGDVREWIVRPLLDVRDRIQRLPEEIARLSADVELLEVLLDLEVAGLRSERGDLSPAAAGVVRTRTAVAVWLPELSRGVEQAHRDRATYDARLARLDAAHASGTVADAPWRVVRTEYAAARTDAEGRLAALEARARAWRDEGPALLEASRAWVEDEVAILDARRIAEGDEPDPDRRALLLREARRVDEAQRLLAAL